MSVNWEEAAKRYVVRFRDVDGRHRTVTVNAKNLDKYGLSIPKRITERVAKRLEAEILHQETSNDGLIRGIGRQGICCTGMLWHVIFHHFLTEMEMTNGLRGLRGNRWKMNELILISGSITCCWF